MILNTKYCILNTNLAPVLAPIQGKKPFTDACASKAATSCPSKHETGTSKPGG